MIRKAAKYIMEFRELRYFLAVAREENITRAAESLHITQPSLSKQLMELEKKLGKKLLIRGKKKDHSYGRRCYPSETCRGDHRTGRKNRTGNQLRS